MRVELVDEARREFLSALEGYTSINERLGQRFRDAVAKNSRWIAAHPELYSVRSGGYRRVNLKAFPFYLPYVIRGETVWILAVAHGSREPEYWIEREQRIS